MPRNSSTSKTKKSSGSSNMQSEETMLKELFIEELRDIYWAEKKLVKKLPKLQEAATTQQLKDAIGTHL